MCNHRWFGHIRLWEPPIALPLDSLEHRLHGSSENLNISCCFLLRLMQTSWWHRYPFVHRSGDVRVVFILKSFKAPCHASLGFKNHYHRCMSMTVMESFSIMLDILKPIAWTYKTPKEISLENLIDTRRHTLFIFVCFGWGLNSGCWATNQG
jgi:hypothetical protein